MTMTKKEYIEKGIIYTNESNVSLCLEYLDEVLKRDIVGISLDNSFIVDPSAGNGAFFNGLKVNPDFKVAIDIYPNFEECIKQDFLAIKNVNRKAKNLLFIGFPHTKKFEAYVEHSMKLGADLIAFIMPNRSTNKKNKTMHKKYGYSVVFNKPLDTKDFHLPDNSKWSLGLSFVIIAKDERIKVYDTEENAVKSYKDIFTVSSINDTTLIIRETSQPHLFKDGKIPKNRKTGEPYEILIDENGKKYYYQNGVNLDKKDTCDLYLPLRVFPKTNPMSIYRKFESELFGGIGFGLKAKDGFIVKNGKTKGTFIVYKEKYTGVFVPAAKIDYDTILSFYSHTSYNTGVYLCSKKLIEESSEGIF